MIEEENFPVGRATMRVDSFEVIDLGPVDLTDEEKTWPVGRATMRVDSFEVIDLGPVAAPPEVGLRLSVPTNLPPEKAAALLAQVRAAISSIPAEAGRFVVELAPPAS